MTTQREQTALFLKKASADEKVLETLLRAKNTAPEMLGFLCQQAAEKYLKAVLTHFEITFPRTHNLRFLADLLTDHNHPLPNECLEIDSWTPYGTVYRYDDVPDDLQFYSLAAHGRLKALQKWAVELITGTA